MKPSLRILADVAPAKAERAFLIRLAPELNDVLRLSHCRFTGHDVVHCVFETNDSRVGIVETFEERFGQNEPDQTGTDDAADDCDGDDQWKIGLPRFSSCAMTLSIALPGAAICSPSPRLPLPSPGSEV